MPMLMRANRGMVGGSERRCGIAMSGSDIAMPQKPEAATARKLCLSASLQVVDSQNFRHSASV
eukprot:848850-Pleurochrysis_carterae.AAC.1